MHADFWHDRWSSNQLGFHENEPNPLLVAQLAALGLNQGARVFVPLCGKTLDIDWLLAQGYRVAGAELSPLAVEQLFARLGSSPTVARAGGLERRSAPGLDIFVGDIFELSPDTLGAVDGVYDRAALIALPPDMRRRYAAHLQQLTQGAVGLLISLAYDQRQMAGPPFSVSGEEVRELFGARAPRLLTSRAVSGGLKGVVPATESVWLLDK